MMQEEYITFLKRNGYHITSQRRVLLSFFCSRQNAELSAQQVIDHLKNTNKKISFDTVYKNLSLFVELGFLNCREDETKKIFSLNVVDSPVHY
ncbi:MULTISPECIES: transcriptional repressor [Bacillaceae]|uniref:Fur family transcriptional regulator n=1 Tax=Bacillaceae TaxID=186817 RepID=UPI001047916B|nr:transcriptional repressor [Bacillus sp. CBEL-1]TDB53139.1 hypothetical protein EPL02_06475 [Bacillus sp. CBEL-1]